MHILSPETDNNPSWISRRERMTVENISWSISMKECCRPRQGSNLGPLCLQSDVHPTEPPRPANYGRLHACFTLTLAMLNKLMPHLLPIFSQSDYLIQVLDTNSRNDKHCRSRSEEANWSGSTLFAMAGHIHVNTVEPRYLKLAYFELPLISKWKSGPCFNMKLWQQVTK